MPYTYRAATAADADDVIEIVVGAFGIAPGSSAMERSERMARTAPHEFRVLEDGGSVLAALHIGDTWIQVGQCAVLKGDVGHVAVRPELQGQGIGTTLMRLTVDWMRDSGYHISRLGGLVHFYSRFGYEPFPRRFVEFLVRPMKGGASLLQATEVYTTPTGFDGTIRPYDEARDWRALAQIRYEFNKGRSGVALVTADASPPRLAAPPDPHGLRFVFERDAEVLACLLAAASPADTTGTEICYAIHDFACKAGCAAEGALLVRHLLSRIAHEAPLRVTSRLPFDDELAHVLQTHHIGFERNEWYEGAASNMIKVCNLGAIVDRIRPELERRLAGSLVSDWAGVIELAVLDQTVQMRLQDGSVAFCSGVAPDVRAQMSQAEFVKLLFGINGFDELPVGRKTPLGLHERAVMNVLLPRCQSGSGPWG